MAADKLGEIHNAPCLVPQLSTRQHPFALFLQQLGKQRREALEVSSQDIAEP